MAAPLHHAPAPLLHLVMLVALVLLVTTLRVEVHTVHCLHVLPQRARVRVTLCASWCLAHVRFLIGMGSVLVLRPVAGVAEGFRASWELTHVRLLSGVRSQVGLQVLQTTVRLPAALERALVRLLPSVPAHVNDEHVLCLERFLL